MFLLYWPEGYLYSSKLSSELKWSGADDSQLPWFARDEYDVLGTALANDDEDGISDAAKEIDRILRLAAATLPRDTESYLLGLLEETRSHRHESMELAQAQHKTIQVSTPGTD